MRKFGISKIIGANVTLKFSMPLTLMKLVDIFTI